jgi:CheY-like chemotaxis protein
MKHKILIIDDDLEDQEFLLAVVKELYPASTSVTTNNGAEALDYIEKNPPPPELVFLDLNMPLVNGFEFLTAYKKDPKNKDSHVIVYTTSSHPRDRSITRELGASDFITKVHDMKLLKQHIVQAVAKIA